MACDMPEPCEILSLDSCQKRFLGAHKEVDFASHSVDGLMIMIRRRKFLQCPFSIQSGSTGCFTIAIETLTHPLTHTHTHIHTHIHTHTQTHARTHHSWTTETKNGCGKD